MRRVTREKVKIHRVAHRFSALGLSYCDIFECQLMVCVAFYAECQRRVSAG